jgi:peptidoglycan hydrolase CwlO-like protein
MTTNQEWLFSLTLEEYLEWMESEHYEPNPDCSAMLYKTFTGNMCSHYEPKDGVVAILREAASNLSDYHDAGEALRRLTDTTNVYHALETLADMIERDYVRRESIEEVMDNDRALVEENSMLARELLKLKVELEKATNNLNSANEDFENARAELVAERDELKGQVFTLKGECEDLENELHELTAERDELQERLNRTTSAMNRAAGKWAKAESRSAKRAAAVERLRQLPPMDTSSMRYVRAMLGSVAGMTAQDVVAELIELLEDDELTTELDAAKQQISRFDAPKSVETSENPASKCEISDFDDSRELLEADIRKYANPEGNTGTLGACWERKMFEFIDRQAAITDRETKLHELYKFEENHREHIRSLEEVNRKLNERIAELQSQSDEKWNLYVAEHGRADSNAADREMYRKTTTVLMDSITEGLRKVDAILDGKDEGLA